MYYCLVSTKDTRGPFILSEELASGRTKVCGLYDADSLHASRICEIDLEENGFEGLNGYLQSSGES